MYIKNLTYLRLELDLRIEKKHWIAEARSAEAMKAFFLVVRRVHACPHNEKFWHCNEFLIIGGRFWNFKFPSATSAVVTFFFKLLLYRVFWASRALFFWKIFSEARDTGTSTFQSKIRGFERKFSSPDRVTARPMRDFLSTLIQKSIS